MRIRRAEKDRERLFVPLAVVLETIWVLESAYDRSRDEVLDAIRDMRQMPVFEFEKDDVVERFLTDGQDGKAGLADILIAHSAQSCGCAGGITFDRRVARLPFFSLLK